MKVLHCRKTRNGTVALSEEPNVKCQMCFDLPEEPKIELGAMSNWFFRRIKKIIIIINFKSTRIGFFKVLGKKFESFWTIALTSFPALTSRPRRGPAPSWLACWRSDSFERAKPLSRLSSASFPFSASS